MSQPLHHRDLPLFKGFLTAIKEPLILALFVSIGVFIGIGFFMDYTETYYANKYIDALCISLLTGFAVCALMGSYNISRNLFSKVIGRMPYISARNPYSHADLAIQKAYNIQPFSSYNEGIGGQLLLGLYGLVSLFIWMAMCTAAIFVFLTVFEP